MKWRIFMEGVTQLIVEGPEPKVKDGLIYFYSDEESSAPTHIFWTGKIQMIERVIDVKD